MEDLTPTPQTTNTSSSSSKIIIAVVAAVLLLVVTAAGAYYYGKMDKQKEVDTAKTAVLEQVKVETAAAALKPPAKATTEVTCNADELSLNVQEGSGTGAGTLSYDLVFTNTGSRTCDLFGYPGVSLVDANGNMIGEPAVRTANATEVKQTLVAGGKVKAEIKIGNEGNFTDGQCLSGATKLRVYPPNDTGYLSTASPLDAWCPGFEVSPVTEL